MSVKFCSAILFSLLVLAGAQAQKPERRNGELLIQLIPDVSPATVLFHMKQALPGAPDLIW